MNLHPEENHPEDLLSILNSNCSLDEGLLIFLETLVEILDQRNCEKEKFESAVRSIMAFIQTTLTDEQHIEVPVLDEENTIDYMRRYLKEHPEARSDVNAQKRLLEGPLPSGGSVKIPRHVPIEYLRSLIHQMNFMMGLLPEDHPIISFVWVLVDIVIPHAEIFVPLVHFTPIVTHLILNDQIEGAMYRFARNASKLKDSTNITSVKHWSTVITSENIIDLWRNIILPMRSDEIPNAMAKKVMSHVVPIDKAFANTVIFPLLSYPNKAVYKWRNLNHEGLKDIIYSKNMKLLPERTKNMANILVERNNDVSYTPSISNLPFEDASTILDKEFWERFSHRGIVCGGGCALSLLINEIWKNSYKPSKWENYIVEDILRLPFMSPRDIDLFLVSPAENTDIIDEVLSYFAERAKHVNANVITYKTKHALNIELVPLPDAFVSERYSASRNSPRPAQIILRVFSCVEEVLMAFDQAICRVAWDGSRYFISPCAAYCLANGFCIPLPFHGPYMSVHSLERLYTYDTRGIMMVLPYTQHFRAARARLILDGLLVHRQSLADRQDPMRYASVGMLSLMSTIFDRNLTEMTHSRISFVDEIYGPDNRDALSLPRLTYEMWQDMIPEFGFPVFHLSALKQILQLDIIITWDHSLPEWALSLWQEKSKDRELILKALYDIHGILWDGQILTEEYLRSSCWKNSPVRSNMLDDLRKTSSDPWIGMVLVNDDIPPPYYG